MKITIWVACQSEPGYDGRIYSATTNGLPPADVGTTPHINPLTGEESGLAYTESFYGDWEKLGEVDGVLDVRAHFQWICLTNHVQILEVDELGQRLEATARDNRYSVELEYYGAPCPAFIVRFCGEWIGVYPTEAAARARCFEHREKRLNYQ